MFNFNFLLKCLGLASGANFMYDFSKKIFSIFHSIDWPNSIALLPLLLEILDNKVIVIIRSLVCDVINFEIKLSFLIKLFFNITKKSGQKCK